MKSSHMLSLLAISALTLSSAAFAAGQGGGARSGVTSGTQSRIHTPGTGQATGTATQSRIHTPGTGAAAGQGVRAGGNSAGTQLRIHPPGTGLTTVAPVVAPTAP